MSIISTLARASSLIYTLGDLALFGILKTKSAETSCIHAKMNNRLLTTICCLALSPAFCERAISATVSNGSFESGLASWTVEDNMDTTGPLFSLSVMQRGSGNIFSITPIPSVVIPSEGEFALVHVFDGIEPGRIRLFQDIGVPLSGEALEFDYRVSWDLLSFGATLNRTFAVEIKPAGGGIPFASFTIFTAAAGTTGGTSPNRPSHRQSGPHSIRRHTNPG